MSPTIILALAVGALITLFDGISRYNTRDRLGLNGAASTAEGVDIPPRYFTSERGYLASFLLYLAAMETIYLAPAIAAPSALLEVDVLRSWVDSVRTLGWGEEVLTLTGPVTFPILWALLLAGALRYLPWINHIEPQIRRMCHNIAEIPHFVHELARRLYMVEMNLNVAFPTGYRGDLRFVALEDFNAHPSTEERAWARLSYLMRELEEVYTELGNLPALHFGARFAEEYENAASEFRSLTYRMARYLDEREGAAAGRVSTLGADHRFKADLRRALGRAGLLFVVLLNLKQRDENQIGARLLALGFQIDRDRLRAESGPDAAVTVLALAAILFIVCPTVLILVDVSLAEFIGHGVGHANGGGHTLRFAGLIEFPDTILRTGEATFVTRILLMLLMSFVMLLVLALVNLTIARRFGGIDPREMFEGQWLQRPYDKYIRAAALTGFLSYATSVLMVYALILGGFESSLPIRFDPLFMTIWIAPMFIICLLVHVFAQTKGHSLAQVIGEGLICGVIWGAVCFIVSFFYFTGMGEIGGDIITRPVALGGALYYGLYAFLVGTPFMAALLFVSKSARQIAERNRTEAADLASGAALPLNA